MNECGKIVLKCYTAINCGALISPKGVKVAFDRITFLNKFVDNKSWRAVSEITIRTSALEIIATKLYRLCDRRGNRSIGVRMGKSTLMTSALHRELARKNIIVRIGIGCRLRIHIII
jgi:hypothetical protein